PSLDGEPIESFSHRVATTWKLGRAGIDNGVLLLIAARDRRVRIEVGYGLEPVLPDGLAGAIIRESLAPDFRRGDYARGINQALDRIFEAARKADLAAVPARRAMDARRGLAGRLALYLLFGLAVFGLAHPLNRRFMGKGVWSALGLSGAGLGGAALAGFVPWGFLAGLAGVAIGLAAVEAFVEEQWRCPRCGGWLRRTATTQGTSEIVTATCSHCGFATRAVQHIAAAAAGAGTGFWLGGGGGGWGGGMGGGSGFSGGGGDFGGGGASGSW
ncbi:MAG TPA: TPM domain-containing protein, partial [Candidatus Sulfotelmatobacter sp.]|nr:TPM domain-containing protein [Candidatus Sulfotelmatobacter sp.]